MFVVLPSINCATAAPVGMELVLEISDVTLIIPPDEDRMKYSLFTQFRKQSGMLPTIARLISLAAISLNSVVAASLKNAACGVHNKFGASLRAP